jgi:hypothetical protein
MLALRPSNIESLDQSVLDLKDVADHLVHDYLALEITHDLMDFDDNLSVWTIGELDWLNMRINHRPLARPIATHAVPSANVSTFHSVCPDDVLVQGREHSLHVAGVEPIVEELEQLQFAGQSDAPFTI